MATNSAEMWTLLRNVLEAQKDTDRKFQDTERLLKEQSQNTDRLLKEQSGVTDWRIRPVNDQ